MTEDICGSTDTSSGEPCQNDAESCPWHNTDNPPDTGRPSKLSSEVQESIATDIESGRSMRSAARKQELDPTTIMNWMQRGEAELEEGKENEYTQFFKRITRAKGYGEEWYMKTIIELAEENEDHRFLMSLMKQRYPDSWGETETGVDAGENTTIELPESVTEKWERKQ